MTNKFIPIFTPRISDVVRDYDKNFIQYFVGNPALPPLTMKVEKYGVQFDFNKGLRLYVPAGNWRVKIWDATSQIIFFDGNASDVIFISLEKFFINWEFELYLDGNLVFHHRYNPAGRNVHFYIPLTGMGDHIAMFPCIEEFCRKWKCRATLQIQPYLRELVKTYFPTIECVDEMPPNTYAWYHLSPGFSPFYQPTEIRKIPMLNMGREILNLGHYKKKIYHPTKPRKILEPYVCIAAQTSMTVKAWLNAKGWDEVVAYLKSLGYRVLCIDKNSEQTDHGLTIKMPSGAEDFTGDISLLERVNLLAYADFFIGLGSGLSWLAWAVDIPVILISGISSSWCEFENPYRVINRLVCNSCHNDTTLKWPQFELCPYHKNTPRAYECSRAISGRQVIEMIDELRRSEHKI